MLIDFTVSNWMSFREETQLSMIGANYRRFSERTPRIDKFQLSILPVSIIFGANATGKSNLVCALEFARKFVLNGTKPDELIERIPFLLNPVCLESDTKFEFVLLIDELIYEYSFSVNSVYVTEEKLVVVNSKRKVTLFHRIGEKYKKFNFPRNGNDNNRVNFLNYIRKGTRKNELFLTNSVMQNETAFRPVFDWFSRSINIITPSSEFMGFEYFDTNHPYHLVLNDVISKLDFGITSFESAEVSIEQLQISKTMLSNIMKEIREGKAVLLKDTPGNFYMIKRENGKIIAEQLLANHLSSDGSLVPFEIGDESDGTRRVMDLLPAFYNLAERDIIVVIDEIERSMHSVLIQSLIEAYLEKCTSKSRSQLIFTTHNTDLMNSQIIRPDEIWVTEKILDGSTTLHSLSEYKDSQTDNDFRKSYFEGRFGGVPNIQIGGILDR